MNFMRARSKEQFEQREQEIIQAAIKLYKEFGYEGVTFTKISAITKFTRPTIYNYFATKEEILLKVILVYIEEFGQYIEDNLDALEEKSIENIASVLTEAFIDIPEFINLYTFLYSLIENNVSVESLASFKKSSIPLLYSLAISLKKLFPNADDATLYNFILFYFSFVSGFYPMTLTSPIKAEAIALSGTDYIAPNFKEVCKTTLTIYLESL